MGKHLYKKPEPSNVRGLCVKCGKNLQKHRGNGIFRPLCSPCDRERHKDFSDRPYRMYVDSVCHVCGFTSSYPCQFDVDHIDGNHANNVTSNLWTLCANCHRLKTWIEREARRKHST